ncbi:hypothetical protein [Acidocella sp.]|uniref:hypothetical protein n=1 Tax=Acidocella sp. TaxID=50710 RepID=UPI002608BD1C|nr:hypothetical protein [Acidocella sp.]
MAQGMHGQKLAEGGVDFDAPARKGWHFFTKFMGVTVVLVVIGLLLIGSVTVWS